MNTSSPSYGYKKEVTYTFVEALNRTKQCLAEEGFGVLTEIDVKATLEKKLQVAHADYYILGACNPPFALEALKAEIDIGLLLPCNVIVYANDDKIYVSAILPTIAMAMVENPTLAKLALTVEEKLKRAIDHI